MAECDHLHAPTPQLSSLLSFLHSVSILLRSEIRHCRVKRVQHVLTDLVHAAEPTVLPYMREFVERHTEERMFLGEAACITAAKLVGVTTRAMVFGGTSDRTPMVNVDDLLNELATCYESLLDGQRAKLEKAFSSFDEDGNGTLSLQEFKAMLPAVHDLESHPLSDEAQEDLYSKCLAMGDGQGTLNRADLQQLLFCAEAIDHAQNMEPHHLELAAAQQGGQASRQLAELTKGWNSMRSTVANADEPPEMEGFQDFLHLVVRIQRVWSTRVRRMQDRIWPISTGLTPRGPRLAHV